MKLTKYPLKNLTGYKERFEIHQSSNIESGFKFNKARDGEYDYFRRYQGAKNLKTILEFPPDGLYLNNIFPYAKIDKIDLIKTNDEKFPDGITITDFSLSGIERNYYDAVFCVTPIHHATDHEIIEFLNASFACLKKDGLLIIGEVLRDSKEAYFLDEFVNAYTLNGHKGNYPDIYFTKKIQQAGFSNCNYEVLRYPWIFESKIDTLNCISQVLGLEKLDQAFLFKSLDKFLGITKVNTKYHLNWGLVFFEARKLI